MSSDTIYPILNVTNWTQRVQKAKNAAVRLQTQRDGLLHDIEETVSKIENGSLRVELLTKAGEALRMLMDKLGLEHVKMVESVVTEGLKTIFADQDLAFESEVGHFRNKISIDLLIRRKHQGIEVVGPPLESTGGGVSSVASLLLRLLALLRLKKFPLLLLDETLSAVSDEYVDATGQFLAKLSESSKIPILLVTHKTAFLDHAKNAYQATEESQTDGPPAMKLQTLRGAT